MDINMRLNKYYEQFYAHTPDSFEEMDQFLKRHKLPKLIQEEIDNLISPISMKKLNLELEDLPKKKIPGTDGFTGKFYQHLRNIILHSLFQNIEEEGTLPNTFYEVSIAMTAKPDKDHVRKEKQRLSSLWT